MMIKLCYKYVGVIVCIFVCTDVQGLHNKYIVHTFFFSIY